MEKTKSVEAYINKHSSWEEELIILRELILNNTNLAETIKWQFPTYTFEGKNVVSLSAFKSHFGIWFYQGALLEDKYHLLKNAQDGKTKAMRQINFTSKEDINEKALLNYLNESIENFKQGRVIKASKPITKKEVIIPKELDSLLKKDDNLNKAFHKLSPSKRREYCEYISTAKREATKSSRIEKITPLIKEGIGLNDKYKK